MPLRRHRKITWVALLAIAAQLILSFGHVHGYRHPHLANASNLSAAIDDQGAPEHPEDLNGTCALCWLTRVAGALVLPELVSLPVRASLSKSHPPARDLLLAYPDCLCVFQARGPPTNV
jgi:hypothetical protein